VEGYCAVEDESFLGIIATNPEVSQAFELAAVAWLFTLQGVDIVKYRV
jgi:hypothetical protein